MALATNYTNGNIDKSKNEKRIYRLTGTDGSIFFEGTIEEITAYTQEPSVYGARDINDANTIINGITPEVGEDITV